MAIEIERKFLVNSIPIKNIDISKRIKQGYIINNKEKTLRIRQSDDDYTITIKGKTTGISRLEFEYPIPKKDADILFNHFCDGIIIHKTRHYVCHKNFTWEIDQFHDQNHGLIIAEIELKHENEQFELPNWVGNEITDDPKYYNMSLSTNPYENWKF